MKNFLLLAVVAVIFAGCSNNYAGAIREKSFAQQYAELESEPLESLEESIAGGGSALQTAADRTAEVALAAQSERRAQPPLVESNYFFRIMPDKGVYSYDEYNQVWTDAPKDKDYKEEKRLWNKPKRHEGDYDGGGASGATASRR
jgi:hypothetical protein